MSISPSATASTFPSIAVNVDPALIVPVSLVKVIFRFACTAPPIVISPFAVASILPSPDVTAPPISILSSVLVRDTFCFACTSSVIVTAPLAAAVTPPSVEVTAPFMTTMPASALKATPFFALVSAATSMLPVPEVTLIAPPAVDNAPFAFTSPFAEVNAISLSTFILEDTMILLSASAAKLPFVTSTDSSVSGSSPLTIPTMCESPPAATFTTVSLARTRIASVFPTPPPSAVRLI